MIAIAGFHSQRRKKLRIALSIGGAIIAVSTIFTLDAMGLIRLVPEQLRPQRVRPQEPEPPKQPRLTRDSSRLREKLLGLAPVSGSAVDSSKTTASRPNPLNARSLFEDEKKAPTRLRLESRSIRAQVALPDGLSGEAIATVVNDNGGATKLCIVEGSRGGELPHGKAEFDVTIAPSGAVTRVVTRTLSFRGTKFADCMEMRIAGWKFPAFDGEPVVVVIPYVFNG